MSFLTSTKYCSAAHLQMSYENRHVLCLRSPWRLRPRAKVDRITYFLAIALDDSQWGNKLLWEVDWNMRSEAPPFVNVKRNVSRVWLSRSEGVIFPHKDCLSNSLYNIDRAIYCSFHLKDKKNSLHHKGGGRNILHKL